MTQRIGGIDSPLAQGGCCHHARRLIPANRGIRMLRVCLLVSMAVSGLSGCTWVKMEPEGDQVRVVAAGTDLAHCKKLGEIGVEVKDKVGFYRRDPLKVRDELEVMARNEAPRLGADTLQPMDEPLNGEQRFEGFRCGPAATPVAAPQPAQPRDPEAAETYPIRED
jgi:hypothetical protein